MIIKLDKEKIATLKNPKFRQYASIYSRIYDDFISQIQALGLEIDDTDYSETALAIIERLRQAGAIVRNDSKSVYINRFSPACEACRIGIESTTFFISLQCHRNCFFCFNPNQEDYAFYSKNKRDLIHELQDLYRHGIRINHIALTGGEPLLFRAETVEFFRYADQKFPMAYKRLYTSGDHVDEATLQALREVHLDEIRFSIRMTDPENARRHTLYRIALAKQYIPNVMVEMPVLPRTTESMQVLLMELNRLDIASINLLEFCFPLNNAAEFRQRGYKIKKHPSRVLYNYWYAGGLPISQSEVECLRLVEFAMQERMKIGVHYCSLENKHTGQIYQQNTQGTIPITGYLSDKDFFIKSAKVFGADIRPVKCLLRQIAHANFQIDRDHNYLEFHVSLIPALRKLDIEVGISWNVLEARDDGEYLREVRIDLTTPQSFDVATDV